MSLKCVIVVEKSIDTNFNYSQKCHVGRLSRSIIGECIFSLPVCQPWHTTTPTPTQICPITFKGNVESPLVRPLPPGTGCGQRSQCAEHNDPRPRPGLSRDRHVHLLDAEPRLLHPHASQRLLERNVLCRAVLPLLRQFLAQSHHLLLCVVQISHGHQWAVKFFKINGVFCREAWGFLCKNIWWVLFFHHCIAK